MKTIATLDGADFLRQCNKIRKEAQKFFDETKVLEIRKHMPVLTGEETSEELEKIRVEQGKKNINDMVDCMLDEYPEETYELLKTLIIAEEGEELTGLDLAIYGLEIMTTQKVIDFLFSLVRLALKRGSMQ